ncbi:Polygalacturonase 1 [Elasticomyces elasticus]|uniref:endo-polygalacturonase n=1 Tax=Elasticomyces elasticus TaxID=574655 RepID=A0AAN7W6P4_9PEZI|nr:Polygalacturonase 1 [Elasticomyces elasticus]
MMQNAALAYILFGAGASIVAAHPAPSHRYHYHKSSSTSTSADSCNQATSPSYPVGTVASAGFPAGTSVAAYPSGVFPSGGMFPSGAYPTAFSTGSSYVTVSSSASSSSDAASSSSAASSYSVDATTAASSSSLVDETSSSSLSAVVSAASPASSLADVSASSGCTFTDLDSAISGKASCTTIVLSGIAVPAGKTLDMTGLTDGTVVSFEGTTTFGYSEWDGPLISFSGTDITIQGATGHLIDMGGDQWWDGEGSNGGVTKPKGFYAHDLTDSVIQDINIKNTPIQCFSINGASNLKVIDITIDNTAGDGEKGGHNTDAFDIGSSNGVYISGANVKNQDDCVAINSGTDISFTGGSCSGGHGLSIGSVGGRSDNDGTIAIKRDENIVANGTAVANVYFADTTVSDSANGVRIKTISGATGSVKNITYSSITLSGITDYGIVIEQDYENGSPTGTPTDGVPITDVTLDGITGTVGSDASPYYILCASCSDWTVSGVSVTGGKASSDCTGEPSGVALC